MLDLEDFCWGGRHLLTWLILGGDDRAAERGEHVGERDGVLGGHQGQLVAVGLAGLADQDDPDGLGAEYRCHRQTRL